MMKPNMLRRYLICGLGLLSPVGCVSSRPKPMDSALFIPPPQREIVDAVPDASPDIAAAPMEILTGESPKNASVLPASPPRVNPLSPLIPIGAGATTEPSESGGPQLPDLAATATATASPQPSTQPVSPITAETATEAGQGVFMTLGSVLVQVNNTPIYASAVLSPLKKEFFAKAREVDAQTFKEFAQQEISKQLHERIEDELDFAMAYHAISEEDRKLAKAITVQVRQERVTAAGGSPERAKRLALEEGQDFDESINHEYRRVVYSLYQRRRVDPLIQVSADDMRDFYNRNVGKLYSETDKAQFRVIEIDPAITGSLASARDKITAIRLKALSGADFSALASSENQNDYLRSRAGNPCDDGAWMERNCYRYDAVEAAVWAVDPGQITPVIETEGAFFIAKLEAKHLGSVRPFEDPTVQDDVYARLRQQQYAQLRQRMKADALDEAIVNPNDEHAIEDRVQVAVDMAMQTYAAAH